MNYFAHGRRYLNNPFFLAGVSVPDWLSAIDRKVRAGSKNARPFVDNEDTSVASVARGIVQHHHDDGWFHATRAFAELSLDFTVKIRDILSHDDGFRPSFLGHILVELLLDDVLVQQNPSELDEYYRVMDSLDAELVSSIVNRMTNRPIPQLAQLIPRFSAERFLYDYAQDATLLFRLNRVMRRVKLPELPDAILDIFPDARSSVEARSMELLTNDSSKP